MQEGPAGQHKFTSRGVIVVDTSVLVRLCVEINESLWNHDTRHALARARKFKMPHFSDALIWLAYHGYEVLIPEMVAYECAQVLRNGMSLQEFFGKRNASPFFTLTKPFLDQIPKLQEGGCKISIQPPHGQDSAPAAVYIRALFELTSGKPAEHEARRGIASLHASYSDRRHFGDHAARGLLAYMADPGVPAFYLTKDATAYEAVASVNPTIPVNWLNELGLYLGLKNQHLPTHIGRQNGIELVHDCINQGMEQAGLAADPLITTDRPPRGSSGTGRFPFMRSLTGLQEEIERNPTRRAASPESEAPPASAIPPSQPGGRSTAFRNKWGGMDGLH